ncbi:MAG TPA: 2-amino-3,7-dideoxy-D-threo-hept-6-ulosonate synthase [Candidatus Thermoplasmatota archaeon]|jgi:class I fructose-bisphosphate aldolase|nr:2-amino-3,7-dideoxy-D-threo-hept-6-ulosonate synthase [Candidatus Thermoplasmatota archaeon]
MTLAGKDFRLRRLADPGTGHFVILPMDHGVSVGPIAGLEDLRAAVGHGARGGATSVVVQKGLARAAATALGRAGLWVHLSASTALNPDPNDKRLVGTVEEAVALGADGISVHVNVGAVEESRMVEDLGRVATSCQQWGMPLLAMMYPRGPAIKDPHKVEYVKHVARLGAELGADVVKVPYSGSVETFREVVRGCPVPVVISGGPRMDSDAALLQMVQDAMAAGAKGVSIGRNAFQHPHPEGMTRAIAAVVVEGRKAQEALKLLKA